MQLHTMPSVRVELTDTHKILLKQLLNGDDHAYALAAKTNIDRPTVVSSLKILEASGFIESRLEVNEQNVTKKIFGLTPPVVELLTLNFERGLEVLQNTMIEEKMYSNADKKAILAHCIKGYELTHRVTFPTRKDGPIDTLLKFYLVMYSNPHVPNESKKIPEPTTIDLEKIIGRGPYYMAYASGNTRRMSLSELERWLRSTKLSPSTFMRKGNPLSAGEPQVLDKSA
jgi:DNA-binding PadR family transcriptional regulator